MALISFPYGKTNLSANIEDARLKGVLLSKIHNYKSAGTPDEIVRKALENPIGSPPLHSLAEGKKKIVIIASDHTRPVPSKCIIPHMLSEIRRTNPGADITLLIATGCHRPSTREELIFKFGEEIVNNEKIVIHDCEDKKSLVNIGTLPSGGECTINKLAYEADLLLAEGFIEPHFFAGYSGGRKSVLPGIAAKETVLANHCSEFIAHPRARTGILEGNPLHRDMVWAARAAGLKFIVNVVINSEKKAIYAVAGDAERAHEKGCEFLSGLCGVKAIPADIVITTNGGYPLDQNIYQAIKGMTAGEACVKEGGVIIMLAQTSDGCGGECLYHQMADERDITKTNMVFMCRSRSETAPDQWQSQVFIRVLSRAKVIYVSEADKKLVRDMHMIPADSLEEAIIKAEEILCDKNASITAIPDGVSVMVMQ